MVNGIYADTANNQIFLATQDSTREFLELNMSDISHIEEKAKINLQNQGQAITFNGSYVFEVTSDNSQGLVIIGPK
jgi:DNA polymerase III sliding clamp (beta) subunit (PCNA family)